MVGTNGTHSISFEELESLRRIRRGVGAASIPAVHRVEFIRRGWVEEKYGGIVLTAVGRYQLDGRSREPGLALIAFRWQRRAKDLRELANNTTTGDTRELRDLAEHWDALASMVLALEQREMAEPMLGDGTDRHDGEARHSAPRAAHLTRA